MDKITIDTYNKSAQDYEDETKDFWDKFPSTIIDQFEKLCSKGRVLDIGSGPGRDALLLQERGLEVVCLDASSAMVELCKQKGLNAVEGDFMSIPFSESSFQGVWAYTSLLHISKKDLDKALIEIKRVLKPGGILGLGMIEGEQELYRHSSGIHLPRYFAFYSEKELTDILKKHGFKMIYFESFKPRNHQYLNYVCQLV